MVLGIQVVLCVIMILQARWYCSLSFVSCLSRQHLPVCSNDCPLLDFVISGGISNVYINYYKNATTIDTNTCLNIIGVISNKMCNFHHVVLNRTF